MHRNLWLFFALMVVCPSLMSSCREASYHRRYGNNSPSRTAQSVVENPPQKTRPFKTGSEHTVKVVGISDGDTFTGLTADNQQLKCRIYGIDAPERKQPFGTRSRQALADLIFGKSVKIKISGRHYERLITWVHTADGNDISAEMLRLGMAWHYKHYADNAEYAELERAARRQKKGLWADENPIEPWKFRQKNR